jgi:hypothetical protein
MLRRALDLKDLRRSVQLVHVFSFVCSIIATGFGVRGRVGQSQQAVIWNTTYTVSLTCSNYREDLQ